MKHTLLFICIAAAAPLAAQNNFVKVGPPPPAIQVIDEFTNVSASASAMADIDNDGDLDVLITGHADNGAALVAELYTNDGAGAFTQVASPFVGVTGGAVAFADVDGDGDQDVVITGGSASGHLAALYLNDGTGIFSGTFSALEGASNSSIDFEDVDGDGDADLLISGQTNSGVKGNLYINDGNGGFTLDAVASALFGGVYLGAVEFADIDNDNDPDLLLMGYGNSGTYSGLFINDGDGIFAAAPVNPFTTLVTSDIDFADVDNDGDQDVVASGDDGVTGPVTQLYTNDGTGAFTLMTGISISGSYQSTVNFEDIDGDNDPDLLITGYYASNCLYTNDGTGAFTAVTGSSAWNVTNGGNVFGDIDNDGDHDLLITGSNIAKLYINDGAGVYTSIANSPFDGTNSGEILYSDVDLDGDQDVFITGWGLQGGITKLYLNDGTGLYTWDDTEDFPPVGNPGADMADIDGDGDEDLLLTGYASGGQIAQLYTNDGNGNFSPVQGAPFAHVSSGTVVFHDVDADGDQDVMITGFTMFVGSVTQLYLNDGTGQFSPAANMFDAANNGRVAFADVDGDGDDDVVTTGYSDNSGRIAKLYANDGSGNFTLVPGTPFQGVQQGAIGFADIDGDNDQDFMISGETSPTTYSAQLYVNDGTGTFTASSGTSFDPTIGGGMGFADVDNDLDMDLLVTGYSSNTYQNIAKLYSNDGDGNFSLVAGTPFVISTYSTVAFNDIDGDDDQDVIINGSTPQGVQTNLYRNENCQQSNVFDVQSSCSAYTWVNGVTYAESTDTAFMAFTNVSGCDSIIWLNLTIGDNALTPDVATLADLTGECEVNALTAPTGMMSCTGSVTATTDAVLPITATTTVTWTYTAPNGFTATQTQNVVIADITAPVPDSLTLMPYTNPCAIYDLEAPTATDNCGGTIAATTNDLPVTTPGTTTITWTFDDGNGNVSTQTQDVTYAQMDNTILFDGITLSANYTSALSYQWLQCSYPSGPIFGATGQTYTPVWNGMYQVVISNGACSVTSDCLTVTDLGVNETAAAPLNIYPNPNTGSFTVETEKAVSLTVTNAAGQLIHTQELPAGQSSIQLDNVESGIYFVSSKTENGIAATSILNVVK
jgi:hypothetical protein